MFGGMFGGMLTTPMSSATTPHLHQSSQVHPSLQQRRMPRVRQDDPGCPWDSALEPPSLLNAGEQAVASCRHTGVNSITGVQSSSAHQGRLLQLLQGCSPHISFH
jgi:hypothetical protein